MSNFYSVLQIDGSFLIQMDNSKQTFHPADGKFR